MKKEQELLDKNYLLDRFSRIALAFSPSEFNNPVTYQSIEDAVWAIKKELDKYGR